MIKSMFVDTNIILDLLSERKPFYKYAARLFSDADKGNLNISVSSLSIATVYYILQKEYSKDLAKKIISKFKVLVKVLSVDSKIIDLALSSNFNDFVDAIQYFTAIENNVKVILTRNIKDFKKAEISVMTPEEFYSSL